MGGGFQAVKGLNADGVDLLRGNLVFAIADVRRDPFPQAGQRLIADLLCRVSRHDVTAFRDFRPNRIRRSRAGAADDPFAL